MPAQGGGNHISVQVYWLWEEVQEDQGDKGQAKLISMVGWDGSNDSLGLSSMLSLDIFLMSRLERMHSRAGTMSFGGYHTPWPASAYQGECTGTGP